MRGSLVQVQSCPLVEILQLLRCPREALRFAGFFFVDVGSFVDRAVGGLSAAGAGPERAFESLGAGTSMSVTSARLALAQLCIAAEGFDRVGEDVGEGFEVVQSAARRAGERQD